MEMKEKIETALNEAFVVVELEVADVSEAHRGHSGFREGGETHFDVQITSPDFKGLSRIARHRAVHNALGSSLIAQIHALSLDISDEV